MTLIVFNVVVMLVALLAGWFAPLQHSFHQRWVQMPAAMSVANVQRRPQGRGPTFVLHAVQVSDRLSWFAWVWGWDFPSPFLCDPPDASRAVWLLSLDELAFWILPMAPANNA